MSILLRRKHGSRDIAGQGPAADPADRAAPGQEKAQVPQHVAIIMDGNGRWARQKGLPRLAGHRAGTENIRRIVEECVRLGIKYLTIYAFSTENWERPRREVEGLFRILGHVIDRETPILHENGVQIRHLGKLDGVPPKLARAVQGALELTKNNQRMVLNVAFNYGGRAEIVEAVRRIIADGVPAGEITEQLVSRYLYTSDAPDPDLIIRTGGEWRLSNFLIWQAAYSEYWSTPVFWPDFDQNELSRAIADYSGRQRRFGRVTEG